MVAASMGRVFAGLVFIGTSPSSAPQRGQRSRREASKALQKTQR
jgi:hypothetical protein